MLAVASGSDRDTLRLAGLVALEDPPRADSGLLVRGLQDLGVRVVMVTGDNLATACAVAQRAALVAALLRPTHSIISMAAEHSITTSTPAFSQNTRSNSFDFCRRLAISSA